jgi:large subunit ribosomal protein L22
MEVRAVSRNVSVGPKKLRPMVSAVRGLPVREALISLQVLPQAAAQDIAKAIRSAMASAENNYQLNPEALRIVRIHADEGIKLRRMKPMARGRAGDMRKRYSHITVVVSDGEA